MQRLSLLSRFSLISLVLFIAIGVLLGLGLTDYLESQAINQQRDTLFYLMPPVLGDRMNPEILQHGIPNSPQGDKLFKDLDLALSSLRGSGLVRVKIYNKDGTIIFSDNRKLIGQRFPLSDELADALDGEPAADISNLDKPENVADQGYGGFTELLEVYTPLQLPGKSEVSGVYEGYFDIDDLRANINRTNEFLWSSIAFGFVFLYISLFTTVRSASQRLIRQSRENELLLVDTRRKAARLQVINELARSINQSSLDLSAVFRTGLKGISRVVGPSGASLTLLDERTGKSTDNISSDVDAEAITTLRWSGEVTAVEKTLLGDADTYLCGDTRLSQVPALLKLAQEGVLSVLLASVHLGDRRLGILRVVSDLPNTFDDDDAAILEGVADQLAVAIENTRLIRETAETTAIRETARLQDEFVSMVSHELRTPLSSIKGYSHTLLAADGDWDSSTRQDFISIIADESDKLAELVENLLEMSRIGAGRLRVIPEPVLLWRFCASVVQRVAQHYPQIKFECEMDEHLPMVEADPRRVEQVLMNLLQNAAKYSGAGVITVGGSYDGAGEVTLSVRDDGIGISAEHLPHLFDKFYRVETGQGDAGAGTGLGLAICKALVEAHGGRIWVESKPGEGTTFFFTLPALIMDDMDGELHDSGSGAAGRSVTAGR